MNPFLSSEVRSLFPGARDKVYFNIAETCLIPQSTADVAHAYVEASLTGRGDKAAHRESVERCREGIAALIGADADEVAVTKNVSEALNLLASSLPLEGG